MTEVYVELLKEVSVAGKPLGRHIEHDEASWGYATAADIAAVLVSVEHKRHGSLFNQGEIGSCTGNAAAGCANTDPTHGHVKLLHEPDALHIYELATTLDAITGTYPPDDTGSSGLAACKALKQLGLISKYEHAFGEKQALAALQARPVMTGVAWYEGFDSPDANGVVEIAGQVRGGHEFEINQYVSGVSEDPLDDLLGADNSWGSSWGAHGRFFFTVRTWAALLEQQGDVTIPIL